MIRSLWLWCRGNIDGAGEGVSTFGYTAGTAAVPVAFLVASVVEAVALHLLVPWPWLRVVLLVLTAASVVAVACWSAARAVHPHLVTSEKLTLRSGRATVLTIDRGHIVRVVATRRFEHTTPGVHDGRFYLPGPDGTGIDIDFDAPVRINRPGSDAEAVSGVSLHVDAPRDLCARLRMEG